MRTIFYLTTIFLFLFSCKSSTQFSTHLPHIQGIWIAEDFKESFDETRSMRASKSAFDGHQLVGFRINPAEKIPESSEMNIGFGILHSHLLFPEASQYAVQNGETIEEQGAIMMDISQVDSMGYYLLSDFTYYSDTPNCYLSINYGKDTSITFTRMESADFPELRITYTRVARNFEDDYPYPNPRDYYVRQQTLKGEYILKDSLGQTLSENFTIGANGICKGFSEMDGRKFEFSTDVYCGPPEKDDLVLLYNADELRKPDIRLFIHRKHKEGQIQLWSFKSVELMRVAEKVVYSLERKN